MAFDFPSSPVEGQEYLAPAGPVYKYIDGKWALMGGSLAPTPLSSFRNRIINGDFAVDQRMAGTALTVSTAASNYGLADRWFVYAGAAPGLFNAQRVLDATLREYALSVTVATADASLAAGDLYYFAHIIEGFNCRDFAWGTASAKPITISFDVKGNAAYTMAIGVGNAAGNRTWLGSFPVTTSWNRVTVTVPGDTTGTWEVGNLAGLAIRLSFGAGSSYQGVAGWQAGLLLTSSGMSNIMAAAANNIQVKNFQLEVGSVATEFERIEWSEQFARCQRYYHTSIRTLIGYSPAAGLVGQWQHVPVSMRAAPTVAVGGGAAVNGSALTANQATVDGCRVYATATTTAMVHWDGFTFTASAEL